WWTAVEGRSDGGEVLGAVLAEVGAFGEVLAQQPVGVLVAGPLPRAVRIAEEDVDIVVDAYLCVVGHLGALVPGERLAQLLGQGGDSRGDRVAHGLGSVSCKRQTHLITHSNTL